MSSRRHRIDIDWRWSRVLYQRGRRLRRLAIRSESRALSSAALRTSGMAAIAAQRALIAAGHVDRVEAAHRWRLQPTQPDLSQATMEESDA